MKKAKIIEKIQTIISEYGSVSTGELETDSPVYQIKNKEEASTIETFNLNDVKVFTYIDGMEIDNFNVSYEELKISTLKEIYELIKNGYGN